MPLYGLYGQKHSDNLYPQQIQLMETLRKLSEIKQLKIMAADFDTGNISVTMDALYQKRKVGIDPTFEEVMESVDFCRMTDHFIIKSVDFRTGEIAVGWVDNVKDKIVFEHLVQEEIDFLRNGQKINCIKHIRERLGNGLVDAKNMMEAAYSAMAARGMLIPTVVR